MRRISILVVLLLVVLANGFAQKFTLNQKLLVHVGYATVKSNSFTDSDNGFRMGGEPNSKFSAEIGYKILPVLSLSGYIGKSGIRVNHYQTYDDGSLTGFATSKNANFYGINTRFHCLPLFVKENILRFDVYLIGSIGKVTSSSMELISDQWQEIYEAPFYERSAGIGLSYNFTKNIGIFGEYQLGRFYNNQKSQWKAGALVTF